MNYGSRSFGDLKREQETECQNAARCNICEATGATCGETWTLDILKLFNELYVDRLKKVKGNNEAVKETLLWWVQDLTEQNSLLVEAVEKLEQEIFGQFNSMASETAPKVPSRGIPRTRHTPMEVIKRSILQTIETQTEIPDMTTSLCTHTQTEVGSATRTTDAQTEALNRSVLRTTETLDRISQRTMETQTEVPNKTTQTRTVLQTTQTEALTKCVPQTTQTEPPNEGISQTTQTEALTKCISQTIQTDTRNQSVLQSTQTEPLNESIPQTTQTEPHIEGVPQMTQTEAFNSVPQTTQTEPPNKGIPQTTQTEAPNETVPQTTQTENETVPQTTQTENETVPQTTQTETPNETVPRTTQTEAPNEIVAQTTQTEAPNETIPQTTQTEVPNETVPQTTQTENETVPQTTQTETPNETVPRTTQTEPPNETAPQTTQTEAPNETAPQTTQTEALNETAPQTTQTEALNETLPQTTQTEVPNETVHQTTQTENETVPQTTQTEALNETLPQTTQTEVPNETVHQTTQTENETVPQTTQTAAPNGTVPQTTQTEAPNETIPQTTQTESASQGSPRSTQTEAFNKNVPQSTQTDGDVCTLCTYTQTPIVYQETSSVQTDYYRRSLADSYTQTLSSMAPSFLPTASWVNHLKSHSSSSTPFLRQPHVALTLSRSAQTCANASSSLSRLTQTPHVFYVARSSQTVNLKPSLSGLPSSVSSSAVLPHPNQLESGNRLSTALFPMATWHSGSRAVLDAQTQTFKPPMVDAHPDTGPDPVRARLDDAEKQLHALKSKLRDSHKANDDTREALTLEVAQKHDQIMSLKKVVQQLEERLLQADKQTHFKDDIIREMRKQIKMFSSKVNREAPDIVSVKPKKILFSRECDCSSAGHSAENEAAHVKLCSKADLIGSLQNELRSMERELNQCKRAVVSGASLSDLEEFRVRTVEAQAAVEDLRDELGELVSESRVHESQMEIVRIALEKCSVALGRARAKLSNWRPPDKESSSGDSENLCTLVDSAREALQQATNCADGFLRGRDTRQELRDRRERRVDRLQEELDGAHDAMRDGVESLSKAVNDKSRQMTDQMREKSPRGVCDGSECAHLDEVNKLRDELNRHGINPANASALPGDNPQEREWLKTELDIVTRNLQAKEKMLADKEEMVRLLQDSLERAKEEIKALKGHSTKKELTLDLMEMHHQFRLCYGEAARQDQWLTSLRSAVRELRECADRERLRAAAAEREADRLRRVALLQTARGNLLEERLRMVQETIASQQFEGCICPPIHVCWKV